MVTFAIAVAPTPDPALHRGLFRSEKRNRLAMALLWYGMAAFGMIFWWAVYLEVMSFL
ncbi:hypothetical protein EV217_0601 [Phyllobacterium myrsinacearum]|uniref:hypothetical protein n=1 Tax=Phyllobacterium myrsinacearum TaxID=28101 RepID=UPI0010E1626F|nr:hypothetical protein [Phyllobacterium myrsinacearum]RZS88218.1 hypothetical protein EV217_0601 [Phyllobacterium myrsinacearum]